MSWLRRLVIAPFFVSGLVSCGGGSGTVPGFEPQIAAAARIGDSAPIDRLVTFGTSLSDTGNAFVWLSEPANQSCGTRLSVPPYDELDDLLVPDGAYAKGGLPRFCSADLAAHARRARNRRQRCARCTGRGRNRQDPTPYVQGALASLANSIATLHAHGAPRFLLLNVPNPARAPSLRMLDQQIPGAAAAASQLSQIFNTGLQGVVQYANALAGVDARMLDIHGLLEEIVASPGTYGFTDTTDACVTPNVPPFQCSQPDDYVFWDGVYPTHAVHALIAQRAIAVVSAP